MKKEYVDLETGELIVDTETGEINFGSTYGNILRNLQDIQIRFEDLLGKTEEKDDDHDVLTFTDYLTKNKLR